jgi:hypothetical protein
MLSAPRTDPSEPNSGIRLLPRVSDGEAHTWPGMQESWQGERRRRPSPNSSPAEADLFCHKLPARARPLTLREMSADVPVYRYPAEWGSYHRNPTWICGECAAARFQSRRWHRAKPCRHCGRPVIREVRRPEPKYVVCSEQCRQVVYSERARYRRNLRRKERPCEVCGERFVPRRRGAEYCSSACK